MKLASDVIFIFRKHIHLLIRYISSDTTQDNHEMDEYPSKVEEEAALLKHLQDPKQYKLKSYRNGIQDQLSTLTGYLNKVTDLDTLREVKTIVTSAINIIKAKENVQILEQVKYEPPNKNISTQRPFFSTKRKRKISCNRSNYQSSSSEPR